MSQGGHFQSAPSISPKITVKIFFDFCQALSISQSLNLSLSLRDRDRADTIITLYHTTTTPHHQKLFKYLRVDLYSSVIHHLNRQLKP